MSELTNIHARSIKDLKTPSNVPADHDSFDNVKLVAGNFPVEYAGNEALTVGLVKELAASGREEEVENIIQYVDDGLSLKAPQATTYTKFEVDTALATKAPQATTYTKEEVDTAFAAYAGGRKAYTTLALAQADQANLPANTSVEVTNDDANSGIYQWDGTTLTKSDYDPLTQAKSYTDAERSDREALIDYGSNNIEIVGEDGFVRGLVTDDELYLKDIIHIINNGDGVVFVGKDGFEIGRIGENPLDQIIEKSNEDTLVVVGTDFFEVGRVQGEEAVTATDIDISEPLFYGSPFCAFDGKPFMIDVPSLIAQRKEQSETRQVIATLSGHNTHLSYSSRDQINVPDLSEIGSSFLTLRNTTGYTITRIPVIAKIAQTSGKSAVSPKILMIGDSITNRGLAQLINDYLTSYSYTPSFIGTMKGALNSESANGTGGQNGEAREGWESGDYTYQITDRVQIVDVGDEATYLASSKSNKWVHNPFLRAATGSDAANIIRNGYVLDFSFYQSRFSLETPDIVVIQIGTNDIRDRDIPILIDQYYSEMTLLIDRIRVAWANAKIILSLPNTAADSSRDELWQAEYAPLIRKMMQIRSDYASDGKVFLCPSWALSTIEAGYSISTSSATTDNLSGALVGLLADPIHPQYVARYQLAHVLSAYIACAADNII